MAGVSAWLWKGLRVRDVFSPLVTAVLCSFPPFLLTVIRKNGSGPRVGSVGWRRGRGRGGLRAKLLAFLISRLACSAPAVAHMLPTRPRGCPLSRILRSTVSWPPQHLINVKYRVWYLSVIIVSYLFDIPSVVCNLLSLFAAVCGKIKEWQ